MGFRTWNFPLNPLTAEIRGAVVLVQSGAELVSDVAFL
jgi:hypothetical protein